MNEPDILYPAIFVFSMLLIGLCADHVGVLATAKAKAARVQARAGM